MKLFGKGIDLVWPWRKDLLRLWHDAGTGRESLLPALEAAFLKQGFRVTRDDGWRCYDLRIWAGPWVLHDLLTVTEYHENGATLTRIRATPRVTGKAAVAVSALGALAALFGLFFPSLSLVAGIAWLVVSASLSVREACRACALVRQVVEGVGRSLGASVDFPGLES